MGGNHVRDRDLANITAYVVLVEQLLGGACTIDELAEESGLALGTVRKFLRVLHRRGLTYVAGWERDALGRWTRPAYAWGRKADVRRPAAQTPSQRTAAMRRRRLDPARIFKTTTPRHAGMELEAR
jgi:predicted ArsR family transcriptional regulator